MPTTNTTPSLLDRITIASPCSADWNTMSGDDRRRFCAACKLHVHDLGAMTKAEAEALLQQPTNGRVCVRLFRRADGTVLTRDCPVGLRLRLRRAFARALALGVALCTGLASCVRATTGSPAAPTAPTAPTKPTRSLMGEIEMGDVAMPPAKRPANEQPTPVQPR